MPKNVNWPTALVVVAGILGICVLVYLKVSPEALGAYAAAFIGLAGALERLVPKKDGAA